MKESRFFSDFELDGSVELIGDGVWISLGSVEIESIDSKRQRRSVVSGLEGRKNIKSVNNYDWSAQLRRMLCVIA